MNPIDNFHFLRPLWLLALAPMALIIWQLWQGYRQKSGWQALIPAHLLEHLLDGKEQTRSRWPTLLAAITGLVAILAMAGPTWEKMETPVEKSVAPLVLVVDLSRSMLAADPTPSRLIRAKQKLTDILNQRRDGVTAIVAYAGSSHVVAPLTDDNDTLINLVRALDPTIMPLQGSAPDQGIARAIELLRQGASQNGDILLITDGITKTQGQAIQQQLSDSSNTLSILGIGSETGAPVPAEGGGFLRNNNGGIVMAQLERSILQSTATGGRYHDLSLDSSDINHLLPRASLLDATKRVDRNVDSWYDQGRWLMLLLIPLILAGCRRGLLLPLLLLGIIGTPTSDLLAAPTPNSGTPAPPSRPSPWQTLWNNAWKTPDQQAKKLLNQGKNQAAASLFKNQQWRAEALDRSGRSGEAAPLFGDQAQQAQSPQARADALYNQANALARAGQLQNAINIYKQALKANPDLAQARTNQKIVEELLKQQPPQKNTNNQNDQQGKHPQNRPDDQQSSDRKQEQASNQEQNQEQDSKQQQQSNDQRDSNSSTENTKAEPSEQSQAGETSPEQDQHGSGKAEEPPPKQQNQSPGQPLEPEKQADEQNRERQPATTTGAQGGLDAGQTEAWLRRIPNDPGGLLRRKFEQQLQRQQQRRHNPQDTQLW